MADHIRTQALALVSSLAEEITHLEKSEQDAQERAYFANERSDTLLEEIQAERRRCTLLEEEVRAQKRERSENMAHTLSYEVTNLRGMNAFLLGLMKKPTVVAELQAYMVGEGAKSAAKGNKIAVIKQVREITGLALKDAKDYVEAYTFPLEPKVEDSTDHCPPPAPADDIIGNWGVNGSKGAIAANKEGNFA